jgi:hypothetical protein
MKLIRLSALLTGPLYRQGNISGTPVRGWVDTTGNRTHNLPPCSAMPQPTAPTPPASILYMKSWLKLRLLEGLSVSRQLSQSTADLHTAVLRYCSPNYLARLSGEHRLSGLKGDLIPTGTQSVSPCWCNNVIHLLQKKIKTKSHFLVG